MQKRLVGILAFCLVGAFAANTAMAASASAAPIINKTGPGKECYPFEGTIYCYSWTEDYEIVERKSSTQLSTTGNLFTGVEVGGVKCSSAGAKEGEVVTNGLTETFGFINKAKSEVGLEVKPTTKEGLIAKFKCGVNTVEVRGGVIGKMTPVNKLVGPTEHFTQIFAQEKGKQEITKFEGGPEVGLEGRIDGIPFVRGGLQDSGELTPLEFSEILTFPVLEFN